MVAATAVYRYLITDGWLTNHCQLNDPNIVTGVGHFQANAILSVMPLLALARALFLYRLIFILSFIHILIGARFLVSFCFAFTWHPKMK